MKKIFFEILKFLGFSSAEPDQGEQLRQAIFNIGSQKRLDECAQAAFQLVQRKDALTPGRPHPYEATILGDCLKVDTLLTQWHSTLISKSFGEANYLTALLANGIQNELQPASVAGANATISGQIAVSKPEAERLSRELGNARHELKVFKGANAITRSADYPVSRTNLLYWIGAIAILEAIGNAAFLREQSQLVIALIIAIAIAALNVGGSVWLGIRYREKNFNDLVRSQRGKRYLLFAVLYILLLNLGVASYRLLMQSETAGLTTQFFFESTILLLVGVALGITAFNKGYALDDPYPGFGSLSRKVDALERQWVDLAQQHADFCEKQKARCLDVHRSLIQRLSSSGQELFLHLPEMTRMIKAWSDDRDQLKYIHSQLQTMFRSTLVANHPDGSQYPLNPVELDANSQLESYRTQVEDFVLRRDSLKEDLKKLISVIEHSQRDLENWIQSAEAQLLWRWPN